MIIPCLAPAAEITDDSVARLLRLSGLTKQVAEMPGMVSAGFDQARQKSNSLPDAQFKEVRRSIEGAFVIDEFLKAIGKELKSSLSEVDVKQLLAWYESAPGRAVTKAEEDASTPAAYQEMLKDAEVLLADDQRMKVARKIDSLVGSTEMVMQLQKNAGIAVYTSVVTVLFPEETLDLEGFKSELAAQEPQMRANIEQLALLSLVYSYKGVDTASMDKYLTFLENPTTKRFNTSVMKGMNFAFNQSIDKMAKALAVSFKSKGKS
jgi:hypothetical protein